MEACDAFVLASDVETFGVVVIEALASAVRSSSPRAAADHRVTGANGLLIPTATGWRAARRADPDAAPRRYDRAAIGPTRCAATALPPSHGSPKSSAEPCSLPSVVWTGRCAMIGASDPEGLRDGPSCSFDPPRDAALAPIARRVDAGARIRYWPEIGDKAAIEYARSGSPIAGLLGSLPNLRLIVGLGAGVDHLLRDPSLPRDVPIVRLVDPYMTDAMSEYIVTPGAAPAAQGPRLPWRSSAPGSGRSRSRRTPPSGRSAFWFSAHSARMPGASSGARLRVAGWAAALSEVSGFATCRGGRAHASSPAAKSWSASCR